MTNIILNISECIETQAISHPCVLLKKKKNVAEIAFFEPVML